MANRPVNKTPKTPPPPPTERFEKWVCDRESLLTLPHYLAVQPGVSVVFFKKSRHGKKFLKTHNSLGVVLFFGGFCERLRHNLVFALLKVQKVHFKCVMHF